MKNKTLRLGATLLIVCAVAALVLAFTNNMTKDIIAQKTKEANEASVKDIFGNDVAIEEMPQEELKGYNEKVKGVVGIFTVNDASGNLAGYAVKSETSGYKGGLNTLTGVDVEGNVKGVRVISHQETNGIGTNAITKEHLAAFEGVSLNEEVNVQGVSGATRTSNGILAGVNVAKSVFELLK